VHGHPDRGKQPQSAARHAGRVWKDTDRSCVSRTPLTRIHTFIPHVPVHTRKVHLCIWLCVQARFGELHHNALPGPKLWHCVYELCNRGRECLTHHTIHVIHTDTACITQIVLENYMRDSVGQEHQLELASLQQQLVRKEKQVELFDRTIRVRLASNTIHTLHTNCPWRTDQTLIKSVVCCWQGLSAWRPPGSPPPPFPPPRPDAPPGMLAPPIPPQAVSFDTRLAQLRTERTELENAIVLKNEEIGGPCVRSATNVCGRTYAAAPDPWIAANGVHCAGYQTREALEGTFCGHWGSPVSYSSKTLLPLAVVLTRMSAVCRTMSTPPTARNRRNFLRTLLRGVTASRA